MIDSVFSMPPAHGRIINWLGPEMANRLFDFACVQRDNFQATKVLKTEKRQLEIDLTARRSLKITDLGELNAEFREHARAVLPQMCRQLGIEQFEPSDFYLELVAHGDGAFFAEHRDVYIESPRNSPPISAAYYFHRIPKSFSGGDLRIYSIAGSKKSKTFVEIEPINDTLVFFPSWFPHEVLPVNCPSGQFEDSRFSINCWIHS
jgi:Rps23 Pro-64 3,4-dihydroxylase Tpa1-like proline 4-hydroxylase